MQPFPRPSDATYKNLIKIGQLASEIFKFESVDDGRQTTMDDDGWTMDHWYTISSPCELSAQVS